MRKRAFALRVGVIGHEIGTEERLRKRGARSGGFSFVQLFCKLRAGGQSRVKVDARMPTERRAA